MARVRRPRNSSVPGDRILRSSEPRKWTRCLLIPAREKDFEPWARLREESRLELEPYEPKWSADELSYDNYLGFLAMQRTHGRAHFFAFAEFEDSQDQEFVGGVYFSHFFVGSESSCRIAYWIGTRYHGMGLATEAVRGACRFAFNNFRRVEAFVAEDNVASQRVLERNGFHMEGFCRENLQVNGKWTDHILYAILRNDQ